MEISLNCSLGEVFDKLTILEIKKEEINDSKKLLNVNYELKYIQSMLSHIELNKEVKELINELREINKKLWKIEDQIRIKEDEKDFKDEFVTLARSVYITNDQRSVLKKKINIALGSNLIEEKSYRYMK
tara:strand:+ start:39 stop:425 length:387 start_codon:yes stop_codon:yes gene_type:complete